MELQEFCSSSRVVIVAGKGGVGKTTVTAALAVAAARAGLRVLIVEVEGKSGLTAALGKPVLEYQQTEVYPGVQARALTSDQALLDYLEDHGLRRISKRLVSSGALDVVSTAAPGMKDILVLGKVKSLEKGGTADLVIVDAPAAGHAISFLMSPRGLLDAVRVGPIRAQAHEVLEMLSDSARCQVVLVTIPEETPVNELVETAFALEDRVGVALGPVVVNGLYPDIGLTSAVTPEDVLADAAAADIFVSPREAADLAEAATFRRVRASLQREQVQRLADKLPLPQIPLPFLFTADLGLPEVEQLADAFAAGVADLAAGTVR